MNVDSEWPNARCIIRWRVGGKCMFNANPLSVQLEIGCSSSLQNLLSLPKNLFVSRNYRLIPWVNFTLLRMYIKKELVERI